MTPGNAQLLIGGAAVQRCLHDYTLHEVNMITLNRILRAELVTPQKKPPRVGE